MVLTAQGLVRELGYRLNELVLSTPTSAGSTTILYDTALNQYYPDTIPDKEFNVWVYGSPTADTTNRGVERRATSWDSASSKATLYTAMPEAMTTGVYDIHQRTSHSRKLEAINSGVRHIGMFWARPVMDVSITTTANTWQYQLPSSTLWQSVSRLLLQINTNFSTYPYSDLTLFDADLYQTVDANGVAIWYLQFGSQPPSGRIIRVIGEAEYPDLSAEADILPVAPKDAGRVKEWLLKFARYSLHDWEGERDPAGMSDRDSMMAEKLRQQAWQDLMLEAPVHGPNRIVVPGMGTALSGGSGTDPGWLAALRSP